MPVFSKLLMFILIALVLPQGLIAQKRKAEKEIKALMKQYEAVGLAVVVVKNNSIKYSKEFGYKNLQQQTSLKKNDIFRIASISKSFSATAIMQLAEAGKLNLEDDVSRLVGFPVRNPKYPDTPITLKMLLSHTSGINDSEGYFQLDVINPATNANAANCYNNYAPGSRYEYCNLNYNMIGAIIEKTSNERFDQYITNHILKPLHLYGGYCIDSLNSNLFTPLYEYDSATHSLQPAPNAYHPRREIISGYIMGKTTPVFSPTGGMKISAYDLARYMMMHMNYGALNGRQIISENSSKQMQQVSTPNGNYGYAIMTTDKLIPGIELKGHTGSAYGLYSFMFFNPVKKYGFVLITNGIKPIASTVEGTNEFLTKGMRILNRFFIQ